MDTTKLIKAGFTELPGQTPTYGITLGVTGPTGKLQTYQLQAAIRGEGAFLYITTSGTGRAGDGHFAFGPAVCLGVAYTHTEVISLYNFLLRYNNAL